MSPTFAKIAHTALVVVGYAASVLSFAQHLPGVPPQYQTLVGTALAFCTAIAHMAGNIGPGTPPAVGI